METPQQVKRRFNFPKQNLRNPFGFFTSFILTFVLYLLITLTLFVNFDRVSLTFNDKSVNIIREAFLQPQTNISANEIFYVDPLKSSSGDSDSLDELRENISFLIFSSLFKETPEGEMEKDIVQSFEFIEGKELRIKLVDNIFWHDGTKLTAEDVIFTLNQIQSIGQESKYYGAINAGSIALNQISETELVIKLEGKDAITTPNAAYLQELVFPILPKHILSKYSQSDIRNLSKTDFGKKPVGSGKLVYFQNRNVELELQRNNKFYSSEINFDVYQLKLYKDFEEIKKDYILKNIDIFTRKDVIGFSDDFHNSIRNITLNYKTILKNRRFVLYFNLNPNKSKSPFATSFVLRDNLQKVINRESLLNSISNLGREIYGPIDQTSWAFSESTKNAQNFSIEDFKRNIEGLGYQIKNDYYEKENIKLEFSLSYFDTDVLNQLSNTLVSDLKNVGVKVNLNKISSETSDNSLNSDISDNSQLNEFNDILNNRNFETMLTIVSQYQDPDRYSEWHSSQVDPPGLNLSGFKSIRSDFALSQARVEWDIETRKDLYNRFQVDFLQEIPAIYLLNQSVVTYYSPKITGIEKDIINDIQYKYSNISDWRKE